jgi:hypothetical protein
MHRDWKRSGTSTPLPLFAGEVGERSKTGEGGAAPPSPASQELRDLSREERAR